MTLVAVSGEETEAGKVMAAPQNGSVRVHFAA
jgi:hypothetical protein